jgi:MFS family permease
MIEDVAPGSAKAAAAAGRSGTWPVAFILIAPGAMTFAYVVTSPLLAPLAQRFGGAAVAQHIIVSPILGLAVGGLLAGWFVERLGRRRAILAAATLFGLAGASGLYAQSAPVLMINGFLLGLAAATLHTTANVVLADRYAGDRRGLMVGFSFAAGCLLSAGGAIGSGLIAEAAGWRASFLLFVALAALVGVSALLGVDSTARGRREAGASTAADFAPLLPIYAIAAFTIFVGTTTNTHMSLLLAAQGAPSPATSAVILSVQGAATMTAGFVYGPLVLRVGRWAIVTMAILLGSIGVGATGVAPSLPTFALGCIGLGAAVGLVLPLLMETTMRVAGPEVRPRAIGFLQTAQFVGGFLNPFVLGPVTVALGLHGMYTALGGAIAVLGAAGLVIATVGRRRTSPSRS